MVRATGAEVQEDFVSKLSRIVQLTGEHFQTRAGGAEQQGFSDPVYAEAVVTIQAFDVLLGEWIAA